jgi:hypothetical protein
MQKKLKKKKSFLDNGKILVAVCLSLVFIVLVMVAMSPASYIRTQVVNSGSCECGVGHALVCSTDGHTYTSVCESTCKGRALLHLGECF